MTEFVLATVFGWFMCEVMPRIQPYRKDAYRLIGVTIVIMTFGYILCDFVYAEWPRSETHPNSWRVACERVFYNGDQCR